MLTNNFKKILKIHCPSSEEDSDSELENNLDEIYNAYKPTPVVIRPGSNEIIEICNENATASSSAEKSSSTPHSEDIKLNCGTATLTKSQKKRQRRKKSAENKKQIGNCENGVPTLSNKVSSVQNGNVPESKHTQPQLSIAQTNSKPKQKISIPPQDPPKNTNQKSTPAHTPKTEPLPSNSKNSKPQNQNSVKVSQKNTSEDSSAAAKKRERFLVKLPENPNLFKQLSKNETFLQGLLDISEKPREGTVASNKEKIINEVTDLIIEKIETIEKEKLAQAKKAKIEAAAAKEQEQIKQKGFKTDEDRMNMLRYNISHVFLELGDYIVLNATNTGGIFWQIDYTLRLLQMWNIPYARSVCCISSILRKTVWLFNNALQFAQRWTLNVQKVFYDIESVILESVMEQNYESELTGQRHPLEVDIFNSFNSLYMNCLMRFSTTMYFMAKVLYTNNPLVHLVQQQETQPDKRFYYLTLTRNIVYKRSQLNLVLPPMLNPPTASAPQVNYIGVPLVQNLPRSSYILNYNVGIQELKDNYSSSQTDPRTLLQFDLFTAELLKQSKSLSTSKEQTHKDDKCQNQLQPVVVEDLTENRRYFYDGCYFDENIYAWRSFQVAYLDGNSALTKIQSCVQEDLKRNQQFFHGTHSETIGSRDSLPEVSCSGSIVDLKPPPKQKCSTKRKTTQNQLQPLAPEDLCESRRYFYDACCFDENIDAGRSFQDAYLDGNSALIETQPETELRPVKIKEEESEIPLSCVQEDLKRNQQFFHGTHSETIGSWVSLPEVSCSGSVVDLKPPPKQKCRSRKRKKTQNQLQPLALEDLCEDRRYFYDGCYFDENMDAWRSFQVAYLDGNNALLKIQPETGLKPVNMKQEKSEMQLSCVREDLKKDHLFLCNGTYTEKVASRSSLPEVYCNGSIFDLKPTFEQKSRESQTPKRTTLETDLDEIDFRNDGFCEELNLRDPEFNDWLMYPLLALLQSDKFRKIFFGIILFILFKKIILWCIVSVYVIVNLSDVVFLSLLFFYLCIYFVIKF